MKSTLWLAFACAALTGLALSATAMTGCNNGGGGNNNPDLGGVADLRTPPDLATPPDMTPECFQNPTTHNEFINSCPPASVEQVEKNPALPRLNPDGTLPPLP